jgi:hypothetical protein
LLRACVQQLNLGSLALIVSAVKVILEETYGFVFAILLEFHKRLFEIKGEDFIVIWL